MSVDCRDNKCQGAVLSDGYCNTCGLAAGPPKARSAQNPRASFGTNAPMPQQRGGRASATNPQVDFSLVGNVCPKGDCGGTVLGDGYCNTCGIRAIKPSRPQGPPPPSSSATAQSGQTPAPASGPASASIAVPSVPQLSSVVSGAGGSTERRRSSATRRSGTQRTRLGVGLVTVKPTPLGDPASALMSAERIERALGEVPEDDRTCSSCGNQVGRSRTTESVEHGATVMPGRLTGFCGNCRTPFNFITGMPVLKAGDLVADQYEILGPLAHGGMGWIYLGRDKAVSDRWVVLKGLLNKDDADAITSAVAERQFLARIEHSNIVNIYNFVTWGGAGYTVMEFVGGESLNAKLKKRRQENGGVSDPLDLPDALAYIIGVLPALGYLHEQGLVYNDLKPANIMATADDVKLIDVGGVMPIDDHDAAIFGTQGFQAPEVASAGPSVTSDLYTVGRTLAVLTMTFVFHKGHLVNAIPDPATQPLLAQWESFHRFLLKATAPHPDDRFQTAQQMRTQLVGVLREIMAVRTGTARPAPSALFTGDQLTDLLIESEHDVGDATWRSLPHPLVNDNDPAASFLLNLPDADPVQAAKLLAGAIEAGQVPWTPEAAFMSALLATRSGRDPRAILDLLGQADPWDWRIRWVEGLRALITEQWTDAADRFSQVWTQLPGEIAPKLAVAIAAEQAGDVHRAIPLYETIVARDPAWVSASFGLARCRALTRDRPGAVAAYRQVPASSAGYFDAQIAAARTHVDPIDGSHPTQRDVIAAATLVDQLQIDAIARAEISATILEQALHGIDEGHHNGDPSTTLFDEPFDNDGIRRSLERTYRELARLESTRSARIALIDKANAVRPRSLW